MTNTIDTPRTLFRKDICKKRLSFYDSRNDLTCDFKLIPDNPDDRFVNLN